uniref:Uncharacterized protein n=1 Tax=Timema shepardi TaxID=629360 RepID=A0A7R9G8X5_TIMSH|nr:unnamed protein product [Timema shepardi]
MGPDRTTEPCSLSVNFV